MELKRDSVIALYLARKPRVAIVRALQYLNVNKSFVAYSFTRYSDSKSASQVQSNLSG